MYSHKNSYFNVGIDEALTLTIFYGQKLLSDKNGIDDCNDNDDNDYKFNDFSDTNRLNTIHTDDSLTRLSG